MERVKFGDRESPGPQNDARGLRLVTWVILCPRVLLIDGTVNTVIHFAPQLNPCITL